MKFRTRVQDEPELNITPLIDIVFLLLIFFMVSTTFKQEFEVGINLPEASSESRPQDKTLIVSIDAKGEFYVNQTQLVNTQLLTLKRALQKIAGNDRRIPVIISADANTPHQAVITAMDAARQLGFSKLSFATQQFSKP